jgi:hypothetical protein
MLSKQTVLFGGLVVCLLGAASSAQANTVTFDGLTNTSSGSATLDSSSGTKIVVHNLGSGGQDGVSIDLTNIPNSGTSAPSYITASLSPTPSSGSLSPGSYMNWTLTGSANGGSNQVIATQTTTYGSGISAQIAAGLSPLSGGQPETITYYNTSTQPPTPVYSETVPSADADGIKNDSETGIVASVSFGFSSGQLSLFTTFDDSVGSFQTASGQNLPNIGMIEYSQPVSASDVQFSSLDITAGGGNIDSFTITSEAVPEPGTLALLGLVLSGLGVVCLRRPRSFHICASSRQE